MRNTWKGLFFGALAGAAVGLAIDVLYGAGDQLTGAAREVRRRAPDAADWAMNVTADARRRLEEADLPTQVRSLAQDIADSEFARQVTVTGREAVRSAAGSVRNATR